MKRLHYQSFSTFLKECTNTVNNNNLESQSPIERIEVILRNNKGVIPMKEESIEVISNSNLVQEIENFLVTYQESVLKVIEYLMQNGW